MKKAFQIIVIFLTVIMAACMKYEKTQLTYFIIPQKDTVIDPMEGPTRYKNALPMPPPPIDLRWYSKMVIIFDSSNGVYLYHTEQKINSECMSKGIPSRLERGNYDQLISEYPYPPYIELRPTHLIKFSCNNFVDFIKANDDIFRLNKNPTFSVRNIIIMASNTDTIKNTAFYDLLSYITFNKSEKKRSHNLCIIRKTTEEENMVLFYKKRWLDFNPEKIKWSDKFINGQYAPCTRQYDSLEKKLIFTIKANETYPENSFGHIPEL
jgi:hypothetical protein